MWFADIGLGVAGVLLAGWVLVMVLTARHTATARRSGPCHQPQSSPQLLNWFHHVVIKDK
ncbi:MAG: hypothetical protein ACRDS0_18955 [Pseudonocardiaceae bacterium]